MDNEPLDISYLGTDAESFGKTSVDVSLFDLVFLWGISKYLVSYPFSFFLDNQIDVL
jgi:hypothetical protein